MPLTKSLKIACCEIGEMHEWGIFRYGVGESNSESLIKLRLVIILSFP